MFGFYEDHVETIKPDVQIRVLFSKMSNVGLDPSIAAIRADLMKNPKVSVTCITIVNHILHDMSIFLENKVKSRATSGLKSGSSKTYVTGGKSKTGTYYKWKELSLE